jgi:RNA polymerase primary sigma factor
LIDNHEQQQQRRGRKRTRQSQELYQEAAKYLEDEEDDGEAEFLSFEVDSFQELQRSTGFEILDDQLQSQIDRASPAPNSFLDNHVTDASYLEKVAMSNVPEQLPQPAVNAFRHQQQQPRASQQPTKKQQQRRTSKKNADLSVSSAQKVSPEEEIELAKMIQRGVWLHKLKTDREASDGRSISRSEWAKLAGLESPTQLRREVATYRRAKQLLVSANMGLVHTVVKKNYYDVRKRSGITYEELVQEGSLGLLRAAELFDPSRGIRFSTYATIWIKGTLSNSHTLDGAIKLPAREKTKWNKIVKAHQELVKEKGGSDANAYDDAMSTVSVEEIANRLDMSVEDVVLFQRKMKRAKSVLSLDYEYQQQTRGGSDNAKGAGNQLLLDMNNDKSMQADADLAERTQMQADVIAAMVRNLTPREARLMRLRYGLTTDGQTRTIQECADAMGVSQARASQLAKACLKKLREAAEADSLEEYLLTIA